MKRTTAIRHLVEMGAAADDLVDRARSLGAAPLIELWVTGDLLTPTDALEWGSVVLVLDLPPDQLTWLARDATAEWVGSQLRLGKRPMGWSYRPAAWPAWNVRERMGDLGRGTVEGQLPPAAMTTVNTDSRIDDAIITQNHEGSSYDRSRSSCSSCATRRSSRATSRRTLSTSGRVAGERAMRRNVASGVEACRRYRQR